jgi:hypothetical protein
MEPPFDINDIADFAYATKRKLKDKNGEEKGAVFYGGEKTRMYLTTSLSAPTASGTGIEHYTRANAVQGAM